MRPERLPPSPGCPSAANSRESLAPFDLLMLLDERPGYPMCFFMETAFSGPLNVSKLRTAIATAARRHPRLRSRAEQGPNGWHWVPTETDPPLIVLPSALSADNGRCQAAFRAFHLRREPGIRAVLFEESTNDYSLVLQLHHSVCDGLAALEFLGDVWSIYHGSEPPRLRPGLIREGRSTPTLPSAPSAAPNDQASATWTFASYLPSRLACSNHKTPITSNCRPYQTIRLSRQETRAVQAAATAIGTAVNDLTIAAGMRALCRWNSRQGKPAKLVRINMPVSLRPVGCRQPATNQIGYAFLDRTPKACESAVGLAQSLAAASRWIRATGAAGIFLDVLKRLVRWPWLLRLLTRLPLSLSTAVISNVGNVQPRMKARVPTRDGRDCPGELVITAVAGVPPVRPGTALAVGVTCYAGELAITALTDPAEFSDQENNQLGEMLVAELLAFSQGRA